MSSRFPSSVSGPLLLREWERLTQTGVEASRDNRPEQALAWHGHALRVAHQLFHDAPAGVCADDRLAAFVVAHLNLADCLNTLSQPVSAGECIHCAHHQLLALTRDDHASADLRSAACKHLHHTFAALTEHHKRCVAREREDAMERQAHSFPMPSGNPPPGTLLH
jgi:hypothetical protein